MLKNVRLLFIIFMWWTFALQAGVQTIAIPVKGFCKGNSVLLLAQGQDGQEEIAGRIELEEQKTVYHQSECAQPQGSVADVESLQDAIVAHVDHETVAEDSANFVYLYFELDAQVKIIRALVVRNSLLEENPFSIVEFSTAGTEDLFEENMFDDEEFSSLDFSTPIQTTSPQVSTYNRLTLQARIVWAIYSGMAKRKAHKAGSWLKSFFVEQK